MSKKQAVKSSVDLNTLCGGAFAEKVNEALDEGRRGGFVKPVLGIEKTADARITDKHLMVSHHGFGGHLAKRLGHDAAAGFELRRMETVNGFQARQRGLGIGMAFEFDGKRFEMAFHEFRRVAEIGARRLRFWTATGTTPGHEGQKTQTHFP